MSSPSTPAPIINALSALYQSTNGANWNDKTNWMNGDPCTNQWKFGKGWTESPFTSDCQGLTHFVLHANNLQGTLPTELGLLGPYMVMTSGHGVQFHLNQLSGTIPSELGTWNLSPPHHHHPRPLLLIHKNASIDKEQDIVTAPNEYYSFII